MFYYLYFEFRLTFFFNFLQKEHNETLAKLNFMLALVDCILELARSRVGPIPALQASATMRESMTG